MKTLAQLVGGLIVLVFGPIWSGYVLSILWKWFLVPTFTLPQLSIPTAIGVTLVVSYLTFHDLHEPEDKASLDVKLVRSLIIAFFRPAIALLFGWVVNQFS